MNKKALMPALLAATGSFAAATGTIGLEVRSDFVYETWNNVEVADPSDFLKNSAGGDSLDASGKKVLSGAKMDREPGFGFNAARLRTDFKGQFANDVKYRLRLRLDKTLGTNAKINSVNSLDGAVDQLESTERDDVAAELDARFALMAGEFKRLFHVLESAFKLSKAD